MYKHRHKPSHTAVHRSVANLFAYLEQCKCNYSCT